jgi:hypothetical protein
LEELNLTSAVAVTAEQLKSSVRSWTTSYMRPPDRTRSEVDSVLVTEEHSDTVYYNAEWGYFYQSTPTYTVQQQVLHGSDTVAVDYFGDKTFSITSPLTGKTDTLDVVSDSCEYFFGLPVFNQGSVYMFKLSGSEIYTNHKNGISTEVPCIDAIARMGGSLSSQSNQTVTLDSNGIGYYVFVAGDPELLLGIRTFSTILTIDGVSYFSNLGSAGLDIYVLGSVSTGNDFITYGPDRILAVLHDPPGSKSYSYIEEGSVWTVTNDHYTGFKGSEDVGAFFSLGPKIMTMLGMMGTAVGHEQKIVSDNEIGAKFEEALKYGNKHERSITFTKRVSTSASSEHVGHNADVYIGNSTNILYGLANAVVIMRKDARTSTTETLDSMGDYAICKDQAISLGQQFGTTFFYTQAELENTMIPKWESIIKSMLLPVGTAVDTNVIENPVYVSLYPDSDPRFGKANTSDSTYYHIIYPANYVLPKIGDYNVDNDSILIFASQIDQWKQIMADNERSKITLLPKNPKQDTMTNLDNVIVNTDFAETFNESYNYSFGGGVKIEHSESNTSSNNSYHETYWVGQAYISTKTGYTVNGVGGGGYAKLNFGAHTLDANSNSAQSRMNIGFVLEDGDYKDELSVDYGWTSSNTGGLYEILSDGWSTPPTIAFKTRGGRTSCPYEEEYRTKYYQPGQVILSEATMQIEKPSLRVKNGVYRVQVPAARAANFTLELGNLSEVNNDVIYKLFVVESSNPYGAVVDMDGLPLTSGSVRNVPIPGGKVVEKTVSVLKGPEQDNYENLKIRLASICQSDPTDWHTDIVSDVDISVEFTPSCSDVHIKSPTDRWVINKTVTGDSMVIEIDDFDRNFANFGHIELQYLNSTEVQWRTLMDFYTDAGRYATAQGQKTLLGESDATAQYRWKMSQIADGNYEIRAKSVCETTSGVVINETLSDVVSGVKDMMLPQPFGKPHPTDGILRSSEDLIITFNEQINEGKISHNNFDIIGIKNDAATDHNTSVHFDGAGVHAISEAEFNLNFPMTLEFWCKRNTLGAYPVLSHGKGSQALYIGFNEDNRLVVRLSGNPDFISKNEITNTEEWGFYAFIYDPNENRITVYKAMGDVFDVEIDEHLPQPYQGKGFLIVGASRELTDFGNFDMHGLCIWQRVLDPATLMASKDVIHGYNKPGLYAYFPMDEGQGTLLNEREKSRHLKLSAPSWRNLPEGKSLYFDGVDDYFVMNTSSSVVLSKDQSFTVDFWFKTNSSDGVLFSCGRGDGVEGEDAGQKMCIGISNRNLFISTNGRTFNISNIDVSGDMWHHVTLSLDRSASANLFIDGALVFTEDALLFGGLEGATMTLGARSYRLISDGLWSDPVTDMYYDGYIDDFKIFSSPLSADYLRHFGNFHLDDALPSLIAYYPFDRYVQNSNDQMELVFDKNDQKNGSLADTAILFGAVPSSETAPIKGMWQVSKYGFDFVTTTNKVLLNLTDNQDEIERTNIAISIKDIEDMHGNRMEHAYLWNVFINRNTLFWDESNIRKTKKNGEKLDFYVAIKNQGAEGVNFTINNVPRWLTISPDAGTLGPQGRMELKFSINEALNPGNYEALLELRGNHSSFLQFDLNVGENRPEWNPDVHKYNNSMAVIGQLSIDNIISVNENDMVGAFINGECVGVGSPENSNGKWLTTLNISYKDTAALIEFFIWDDSKARIYSATPQEQKFAKNYVIGNSADPTAIRNIDRIHIIPLHKGWNWISFNLTSDDFLLANILKDVEYATELKGLHSFTSYQNNEWKGNLLTYGNSDMYMLKMDEDNVIYHRGSAVDPSRQTIYILRGWSWIGYPLQINTTIEEAFADLNPLYGDFVKSQNEIAIYDEHTGWEGTLKYLRPGLGYMYKSNVERTFHYPTQSSLEALDDVYNSSQKVKKNDKTNSISPKFVNNLSMIAAIKDVVLSDDAELIAKVKNEVRGAAHPIEVNGEMLFFMPVYANKERENVKFFIKQNGVEIPLAETINFNVNDIRGSVPQPFLFKIKGSNDPYINVDNKKFTIYPNPVTDHFTVTTDMDSDALLEIVNIMGEVVYVQEISSASDITVSGAPVTNLRSGTYLVKISSAQTVLVSKIIKK